MKDDEQHIEPLEAAIPPSEVAVQPPPQQKSRIPARTLFAGFAAWVEPRTKRPRKVSKDSPEQFFLEEGEQIRRIFKAGESFRQDNFVCTILSLRHNGLRKEATCRVYMPLSDTFIGPTEAEKIKDHLSIEYVCFLDESVIRLQELGAKCAEPKTTIYFYRPPRDAKGTGWSLAYVSNDRQNQYTVFHEPIALDLFPGIGGFSIGMRNAGLDVKYAVELDAVAAPIFYANHQDNVMHLYQEDVNFFLHRTMSHTPGYPCEINHIHASPPCQGFSTVSQLVRGTF